MQHEAARLVVVAVDVRALERLAGLDVEGAALDFDLERGVGAQGVDEVFKGFKLAPRCFARARAEVAAQGGVFRRR